MSLFFSTDQPADYTMLAKLRMLHENNEKQGKNKQTNQTVIFFHSFSHLTVLTVVLKGRETEC